MIIYKSRLINDTLLVYLEKDDTYKKDTYLIGIYMDIDNYKSPIQDIITSDSIRIYPILKDDNKMDYIKNNFNLNLMYDSFDKIFKDWEILNYERTGEFNLENETDSDKYVIRHIRDHKIEKILE